MAAGVALGLSVVYLLMAFGLRSLLHYQRTGSTGFRGLGGRPGSLQWCGGVLFALAVVLGPAGPLLQLLEVVAPFAGLDIVAAQVVGLIVAVAGVAGTLAAQQSMGASWRIGVDDRETTQLVTDRAFALVRNPVFTAMVTVAGGLGLLVPNVVTIVGLLALVSAIEIQVRLVEEPYLLAIHGRAYRDYAAVSGRFVPSIGRLRASVPVSEDHP